MIYSMQSEKHTEYLTGFTPLNNYDIFYAK